MRPASHGYPAATMACARTVVDITLPAPGAAIDRQLAARRSKGCLSSQRMKVQYQGTAWQHPGKPKVRRQGLTSAARQRAAIFRC